MSLGLVLDGWLFTGPLDKASFSIRIFWCLFLVFEILVCLFFFFIVSLSKFLYTFWYSVFHVFFKEFYNTVKFVLFVVFGAQGSLFVLVSLHYSHSFFFSFNLRIWLCPAKPHGVFLVSFFPLLFFLPPSILSLHLSPLLLLCIFGISRVGERKREYEREETKGSEGIKRCFG